MKSKWLGLLLTIVLMLTILPVHAFASDIYHITVSTNANQVTVTGGNPSFAGQTVTVRIVDSFSRNILADETKAQSNGNYAFGPYILENGSYTAFIGGISTPESKAFTVNSALPSTNAFLQSLTISAGTLNFNSTITNYTVDVGNSVTNLTVTAVPEDSSATVTINNSVTASASIPLNQGNNFVSIGVKAQDGQTVKEYILKIIKAEAPSSSGGGGGGVAPSNSYTIAASNSAEFTLNGVKFSVPAGATEKSITVTVDKIADISGLPKDANLQLLGDVFEVKKNSEVDFLKPITIVLPFDKSKVDFDKNTVAVYWLNEKTNKWVQLNDTKVDRETGNVSGNTMHFTKFAVMVSERIQVPTPSTNESGLIDIKSHWAEANIVALVKLGAISGYPDQTFKPDNNITRAEFVSILVKALELTAPDNKVFVDTNGHWAKDSIGTAAALEIVIGYKDNTFRPNDLITREQMAAMAVRAAKLNSSTNANVFKDSSSISNWAVEALSAAADKGLITGYTDGTVKPKANTTRAEAATVILRTIGLK